HVPRMGAQSDRRQAPARALCRPAGLRRDRHRPDVEASRPAQAIARRGARLSAGGGCDMADIRVPTLGESVTEATIGRWFKKAGDAVAVDEPLVELETDKVTIEVPAPSAGTLGEIVAKDGETVAVGALLGQIKEGAAGAAGKPAAPAKASAAPAPPPPPASPKAPPADAPLAPSVRKISAESGIDA